MSIVKKVYNITSDKKTENNNTVLNKLENDEKRSLYIKSKNLIKDAKIRKYLVDKTQVVNEGMTFKGIFTGKNNLQFEKLKNIKLKIELLESQKIEELAKYEAMDILSELYSCALCDLNGKFTSNMQEMYDYVKTTYCDDNITDEAVYEKAIQKASKIDSYLPIIHQEKSKGIFGDIKIQVDFLKLENQRLENQIILERGKSQLNTFHVINEKIIPNNTISCIN